MLSSSAVEAQPLRKKKCFAGKAEPYRIAERRSRERAVDGQTAGAPVDPKLQEFLKYVLSRDGQQAVAQEGVLLPLPAFMAEEELKKLN